MKHTINTIYHGIGYLLIMVCLIICIGAAGNSDLGMDLAYVMRYMVSGLLTGATGLLLVWWKV